MDLSDATVLALGTTGAQGSGLVEALEQHGAHPIRGTSSTERVTAWREEGVAAVHADLTDAAGLTRAVEETGAAAVVLHLPLGLGSPEGAAAAVAGVGAMREAGAAVVINIGGPVPPAEAPDPFSRRDLAAALDAMGAVVLSPTAYLENHLAPWATGALAAGELPYPRPADDVLAWITARDVTTAAVACLASDESGLIRLAGPQRLTFTDLARELGAGTGRSLTFRQVTPQEYGAMLEPYLGAAAAAGVAGFYEAMSADPDPTMAPDVGDVWERLGVRPTPAREWATRDLTLVLAAATS